MEAHPTVEWTERVYATKGPVSRSIGRTAEDGHLIVADLLHPQAGAKGPTLMVTCAPLTFDDGAPQLERFPTFMELVEAADELAPLAMYATMFPTFPVGDREAPPPGPRTIPLEYMGKFVPPGSIEVVGSIGGHI